MPHISLGHSSQAGNSIVALAAVIMVTGVLLVPLLNISSESIESDRILHTEDALERARDALIAYAAQNQGCLPFAADFEGGLPDTNLSGIVTSSSSDTGLGNNNIYGGDLPWAELGLPNDSRDGEGLRLQYYVASAYTDLGVSTDRCPAGYRGHEWAPSVTYNGSVPRPLYVYYNASDGVALGQTPGGASILALDGALVTAGTAVFDGPRRVTVTSNLDDSGVTFIIDGTDENGQMISENVTGPNARAARTIGEFLTVTQVVISGGATGSITVGAESDRGLYKIVGTLPAGTPPNPTGTTLTAAASSNETSLTVASIAGFSSGDQISVVLNGGTPHMTTVNGAPSTTSVRVKGVWIYTYSITITDAMPNAASIGNRVIKGWNQPEDVTDALPYPLLEVRQGPDVITGIDTQTDVLSAQNVFVLIAPGKNRNADVDRAYVRDSNHERDSAGGPWPLNVDRTDPQWENLDTVVFSNTRNIDATDGGNDGDDTLLVMYFNDYKAALSRYGLNMEPFCDGAC